MFHTTAALYLIMAAASAGPLNISTERYIEYRHIEALMNTDNRSGTLIVRPFQCPDCAAVAYDFDQSLRVQYGEDPQPITILSRWRHFTGDVVVSKSNGRVVTVKRSNYE